LLGTTSCNHIASSHPKILAGGARCVHNFVYSRKR